MKKHSGWTMMELVIAIIALIILSGICLSAMKPNIQKNKLYIYAAMKNLIQGNLLILEKHRDLNSPPEDHDNTYDWYCLQIADIFNLGSGVECRSDMDKEEANLTLPSGAEIMGLASPWKTFPSDAAYEVKNILIDVDGFDKGINKIWIDRFPLRILSGQNLSGQIRLVDCKDDSYYSLDGDKTVLSEEDGKSPYCYEDVETITDNKIITYDVYLPKSFDEGASAEIVGANLSSIAADCGAYSGGGIYPASVCKEKGFKALKECASTMLCSACDAGGICPSGISDFASCKSYAEKHNVNDTTCFVLQHKPGVGGSFLLDSVVSSIDNQQ